MTGTYSHASSIEEKRVESSVSLTSNAPAVLIPCRIVFWICSYGDTDLSIEICRSPCSYVDLDIVEMARNMGWHVWTCETSQACLLQAFLTVFSTDAKLAFDGSARDVFEYLLLKPGETCRKRDTSTSRPARRTKASCSDSGVHFVEPSLPQTVPSIWQAATYLSSACAVNGEEVVQNRSCMAHLPDWYERTRPQIPCKTFLDPLGVQHLVKPLLAELRWCNLSACCQCTQPFGQARAMCFFHPAG